MLTRRAMAAWDVLLTLVAVLVSLPVVALLLALGLLEGVRRQLVAAWRGAP